MGSVPPPLPLPQDDRAALTLQVRDRYRQFLYERIGQRQKSPAKAIIGTLFCLSGVLIPLGLWLIYRGVRGANPAKRQFNEELEFIDRAQAVMAYPLMVNTLLRQPGNEAAPGLVIVSFDPGEPTTISYMAGVCLAIGEADLSDEPSDESTWAKALMADEEYQRFRRRRVPTSLTGGHTVYACDLAIAQWYLPHRHISDDMPMIPCLAEPGDQGQIRAIPYWVALDVAPPEWAKDCVVTLF